MTESDEEREFQVSTHGGTWRLTVPGSDAERLAGLPERILKEPFSRRARREVAWFVLGGLIIVPLSALFLFLSALGTVLAITFFGVAFLALALRLARRGGAGYRSLARRLLDIDIPEPRPFEHGAGFFGWLRGALFDRTAWRSLAYLICKIPLTLLAFWAALSLWWDSVFAVLTPFLWRGGGGVPIFGLLPQVFNTSQFVSGNFGPTGTFRAPHPGLFHDVGLLVLGAVFLFAAPWAVRLFTSIDAWFASVLLSPDPLDIRAQHLEVARGQVLDESAATLRRIERDLHDGTQAQLVALAMRLGNLREKLPDAGGDGDVDLAEVGRLVEEAHLGAKETLTDLRDLVRGIHPPALDLGLPNALATLVSRSPLPVALTIDLPNRPSPAIEAIAYFSVAELLANVAQHASANRATVTCMGVPLDRLHVTVGDDGHGGARLEHDSLDEADPRKRPTGLLGIRDRLASVDGTLTVLSPPGGPTVITLDLPVSA